jgi:P27 family predicted phage terminase small subunit
MARKRTPSAPNGLEARGRALWRRAVADVDLDVAELEVLREACRVADVCEALQAILERDGLTIAGSKGQLRHHPALTELRGQRAQLAQLLAQLDLGEDGQRLQSAASVRGRRAARSRWDRHLRVVDPPPARPSRYQHLQGPTGPGPA